MMTATLVPFPTAQGITEQDFQAALALSYGRPGWTVERHRGEDDGETWISLAPLNDEGEEEAAVWGIMRRARDVILIGLGLMEGSETRFRDVSDAMAVALA